MDDNPSAELAIDGVGNGAIERQTQRALARPHGPHHSKEFSVNDLEVYTTQGRHGFAIKRGRGVREAEIGDAEGWPDVRLLPVGGGLTSGRDTTR